jgi:polyphosphate kinase 2 (PPK2 family)
MSDEQIAQTRERWRVWETREIREAKEAFDYQNKSHELLTATETAQSPWYTYL